MNNKFISFIILLFTCAILSCTSDDSFTTSPNHLLTFSTDTIAFDTVFSTVPTTTKDFWAYNKSGDGIRCTSIRLERGNQSGFRVNVDGTYLGQTSGYQVGDVEVRNKDSIRIFVELTSPNNYQLEPLKREDNLVFLLESGAIQKVNLNAFTWDATILNGLHVKNDTTISGEKPIVIYGGLTVDSLATLTINAGTTLYFHNDAGIDVFGKLICNGTAESNVVLRGDRIDRMFDYLPYDNVSGQWQGITFHTSSYNNQLTYTDIHSTYHGITVDSADVNTPKLIMESCTVHNCQGYGIKSDNAQIYLYNCQLTNTLNDCLLVNGGFAQLDNCTMAQFYPFDSNRGVALRFTSEHYPLVFRCFNSLVTGYADDELMGESGEEGNRFDYYFDHCILRTPKIETEDSVYLPNVIYEDLKDTVSMGTKHFQNIDTQMLVYDFSLDSLSAAIDKADPQTSMPIDRKGVKRDQYPDIGAFEYLKTYNHEEPDN